MRRKSERNKSKSSEKKTPEPTPRKTRRTSRRRKRSTSESSSEDSDDAPLKPAVVEKQEAEVSPPSDEPKVSGSRSNSDEDKQDEQPIWKVKTTEAPSGEIQKLKICLQRPPTTPERTEKSPRRRRGKASSQSDDASLTPEEKPHRRKTRRGSPGAQLADSSLESSMIEEAEKDECLIVVKETNEVLIGKGKLDSQTPQESENEECVQDSRTEIQADESLIETKIEQEMEQETVPIVKDESKSDHNEQPNNVNKSSEQHIDQEQTQVTEIQPEQVQTETVEPSKQLNSHEETTETENQPPSVNKDTTDSSNVEINKTQPQITESDEKVTATVTEPTEPAETVTEPPETVTESAETIEKNEEVNEPNAKESVSESAPTEPPVDSNKESEIQTPESEEQKMEEENSESVTESKIENDTPEVTDSTKIEDEKESTSEDDKKSTSEDDSPIVETTSMEVVEINSTESSAEVTNSAETPTEIVESSTEIVESTTKTVESSSKTVESSSKTVESSSKTVESSSKTVESSPEMVESSTKTVESSPEIVESSAEIVESTTEIAESSAETVESSTEIVESSAEVVESSTEIVESSAEVVESSTEIVESSAEIVETAEIQPDSPESSKMEVDSEKIIRHRNWGKYKVTRLENAITSTLMFSFFPSLKLLNLEDVKLEVEEPKERVVKKEREVTVLPLSPKEEDPEREISNIGLNRKISIVNDEASKLQPPPSPAKNPPSSILFITNLVRPFTLKQLQELLSRTGKILEEGFWTDKIKSKCYVQYETEEEAEATRNALHGVQWPTGNGKKLIIDFGTPESMAAAQHAVVEPVAPKPAPEKHVEKVPELKKEEPPEDNRWDKSRTAAPVREWDLGKVPQDHRERSRSRDRNPFRPDRNDKRKPVRNESPSNGDHISPRKKKKEDSEVKMMDDLFHKTKSTPSIYWLPLSPDQIAKKQQQRLQRMAEHKRRMEESRRMERDFGRGAPRSRRRPGGRYDGD